MLLKEAASENIYIIENADFKSEADALMKENIIGINKKVKTQRKKACILAEELGHYHTTVGNILNQSKISNRKQELKARLWAYDKLIGLEGIIEAYQYGCQNYYDMADYLEVTEDFLLKAIEQYHCRYGVSTKLDNYIIYFEPNLSVTEITEP